MAETFGTFGQLDTATPGAATPATLYTVPALTQLVGRVTVANRAAVAATFRVWVAVAGAGDDPKQYLAFDSVLTAETTDTGRATINVEAGPGDLVRVEGSTATITFSLSGVLIT